MSVYLGIDIGGSGVKGALVDTTSGDLTSDRWRIATPTPATVDAVLDVVSDIVAHFSWQGAIGCTFPGITIDGNILSAANMADAWVGVDLEAAIAKRVDVRACVLNDADAAAIAEAVFGAANGIAGTVLVLTFGTGIGSGMLRSGNLIPNLELGQLEFRGMTAEAYAAARLVEREGMRIDLWASRVNEYLQHVCDIFSPVRIVLGGGISRRFDEIAEFLDVSAEVVPAALLNNAGIVGAAYTASKMDRSEQHV